MKRRAIWIAVAIATVLALSFLPSQPEEQRAWQASATTHSPGPGGVKALFTLLEQLELQTARLSHPGYRELSTDQVLWVLAADPYGRAERRLLLDFVGRGGTVVGAPEALAPVFEAAELCRECRLENLSHTNGVGVLWPVALEAPRLPRRITGLPEPLSVYAKDGAGEAMVAAWAYGKGRLINIGVPELARNEHIIKAGNGPFLARLAHELGPRHVFDEFKAGFGEGDLASLIERLPYRWGLLQLLLCAVALLCVLGPRRWPAQPAPPPRRRRTFDHVEAVAHFWRRSGDAGLPLLALLEALDDRARARGEAGATPFLSRLAREKPELLERARAAWDRATALAHVSRPAPEQARQAAAAILALDREGTRR